MIIRKTRGRRAPAAVAAGFALAAGVMAAVPALGAPIVYRQAVLADSPYVYYRQGESAGPTAADAGANNLPGTYAGAPTFGQSGNGFGSDPAVSYDGTSNEYLSASINGFGSQVGTSSYEFVFKVNAGFDNTVIQSLFGVYTAAANLPDVNLDLNTDGNDTGGAVTNATRLFVRGNNADANSGAGIAGHFINAALYDGNYHHLVFTYNNDGTGAGAFGAYVDGVEQAITFTQVNGTLEPAGFSNFDVPAAFAARNVRGTGADPFTREANVTIDEVALYGTVLTPEQVAAHAAVAVPEPAGALALAGAAGVGLLARRHRT